MPPGQYDQTDSQSVAQTFFTAHKNINVFATFGDQMAQGTITAMKLVGGYTPGQNIQIIGYGGAQEIVNEVKSGDDLRHPRPVPGGRVGARHPVPGRGAERQSIPNLVNIINPTTRPAIINQAFLTRTRTSCLTGTSRGLAPPAECRGKRGKCLAQ